MEIAPDVYVNFEKNNDNYFVALGLGFSFEMTP